MELIFESIWNFVIVFAIFSYLIYTLLESLFKFLNIRKHGYPPKWCDANGNFKKLDEEKNDDTNK